MALIKCPECGKDMSDKASACPSCGCPVFDSNNQMDSKAEAKVLCPKCGGKHVGISVVQAGEYESSHGKMKKGKFKGNSYTFNGTKKMAVCQNCGHSWIYQTESEKKVSGIIGLILLIVIIAYLIWIVTLL